MPPFDFPSPPTVGQIVIGPNNTQYQWDGTKWVTVVNAAAGGGVTISDTAPINPIIGRLWFDSVGLQTYIWYTDPTSSQWTPVINQGGLLTDAPSNGTLYGRMNGAWAAVPPVSGVYLPLTGGTLTGQLNITAPNTAQLNIAPTTGNLANITLSKPAGATWASIVAENQGSMRWQMTLGDSTTESGSNAGSNFSLANYADNGNQIGTALSINRATGNAAFSGAVNAGSNIISGGSTVSNNGYLIANAAAGSGKFVYFQTAGQARWVIGADATAESGSNAGSNFFIQADTDAGAFNFTAMSIARATGAITFGAPSNGQITVTNASVVIGSGNLNLNSGTVSCNGFYSGGTAHIVGGVQCDATLQVNGQITQLQHPGAGVNQNVIGYYQSGAWWNGETLSVGLSGTSGAIQYNNGGSTVSWSTGSSDRRRKSNFKPAGDALNIVKRLPVYDLDYNAGVKSTVKGNRNLGEDWMPDSETEHWSFSLIADEVATVLPHATIRNVEEDGIEYHVALHPTHLVATLWRAVQQLTEELDALKAKVGAA